MADRHAVPFQDLGDRRVMFPGHVMADMPEHLTQDILKHVLGAGPIPIVVHPPAYERIHLQHEIDFRDLVNPTELCYFPDQRLVGVLGNIQAKPLVAAA